MLLFTGPNIVRFIGVSSLEGFRFIEVPLYNDFYVFWGLRKRYLAKVLINSTGSGYFGALSRYLLDTMDSIKLNGSPWLS